MTRAEAEAKIYGKLKEVLEIVRSYYPKDTYLSVSILDDGDGYITFCNHYWEHENEGVLNFTHRDHANEKERGGENELQ